MLRSVTTSPPARWRGKPCPAAGTASRTAKPCSLGQRTKSALMLAPRSASWRSCPRSSLRCACAVQLSQRVLRARLAAFVDGHRASRRGNHLHVMLLALEHVRHVPIVGPRRARRTFAALHIVGPHLLRTATDLRAQRTARYGTADCGDVTGASAADLMAENAADDRTGNRSRNIRRATILGDLLLLDPASLLGRSNHRTDVGDVCLVQPLVVAPTVVMARRPLGRIAIIVAALVAVDRTYGRNAVVQTHRVQSPVVAWTQDHAPAAEIATVANL